MRKAHKISRNVAKSNKRKRFHFSSSESSSEADGVLMSQQAMTTSVKMPRVNSVTKSSPWAKEETDGSGALAAEAVLQLHATFA
jgi:hypothetical protein